MAGNDDDQHIGEGEYFQFDLEPKPVEAPPVSTPKVTNAPTDPALLEQIERLKRLMQKKPATYAPEELETVKGGTAKERDALTRALVEDAMEQSRMQVAAEKSWCDRMSAEKKWDALREGAPDDAPVPQSGKIDSAREQLEAAANTAMDGAGITGDIKRRDIYNALIAEATSQAKHLIGEMVDYTELGITGDFEDGKRHIGNERGAEWYAVAKLDMHRVEAIINGRGKGMQHH